MSHGKTAQQMHVNKMFRMIALLIPTAEQKTTRMLSNLSIEISGTKAEA